MFWRSRKPSVAFTLIECAAAALVVACLTGLTGCGQSSAKLYPVRGTVLFKGQPATGAVVVFHSEHDEALDAARPNGRVDASGQFELSTHQPGDGAPAGDYIVTLVWPEERSRAATSDGEMPRNYRAPDRLQGRYSTPTVSTLRATVNSTPTTLAPIELP